jgi:hypothetical protein
MDNTDGDDFLFNYIFSVNCDKIQEILIDENFSKVLDMKSNSLCKKVRYHNPDLPDTTIQDYVMNVYQLLILYINKY